MAEKILLDSVRSVLGSWTVLKLAVQHGFGGIDSEDKAEWLVEVTNQVLRDNGEHSVSYFCTDVEHKCKELRNPIHCASIYMSFFCFKYITILLFVSFVMS